MKLKNSFKKAKYSFSVRSAMFCFIWITLYLYFSLLADNFDKPFKLHNNQPVKCFSVNCRPFLVVCIICEYNHCKCINVYTNQCTYYMCIHTHSSFLGGCGNEILVKGYKLSAVRWTNSGDLMDSMGLWLITLHCIHESC